MASLQFLWTLLFVVQDSRVEKDEDVIQHHRRSRVMGACALATNEEDT